MVALEKAFTDASLQIYLIGNAPTALIKLMELSEATGKKPKVIVGVPVGFVGAAESKEALMVTDYTYIAIKGRRLVTGNK